MDGDAPRKGSFLNTSLVTGSNDTVLVGLKVCTGLGSWEIGGWEASRYWATRGTEGRMGWTSCIGCPTYWVTPPLGGSSFMIGETAEGATITSSIRVSPVMGEGTSTCKRKKSDKTSQNAWGHNTRKGWKQTEKGTNRRGPYHIITIRLTLASLGVWLAFGLQGRK